MAFCGYLGSFHGYVHASAILLFIYLFIDFYEALRRVQTLGQATTDQWQLRDTFYLEG